MEKEREQAVDILETIAEMQGKPRMFDCRHDGKNDTRWYDYEDAIVEILTKPEFEDKEIGE